MPYLATVQAAERIVWEGRRSSVVTVPPASVRAALTAEDLRDYVHGLGATYGEMAHLDCVIHGESRMAIELPNGASVRVAPAGWDWVVATADDLEMAGPVKARDVVDAFNRRQMAQRSIERTKAR